MNEAQRGESQGQLDPTVSGQRYAQLGLGNDAVNTSGLDLNKYIKDMNEDEMAAFYLEMDIFFANATSGKTYKAPAWQRRLRLTLLPEEATPLSEFEQDMMGDMHKRMGKNP